MKLKINGVMLPEAPTKGQEDLKKTLEVFAADRYRKRFPTISHEEALQIDPKIPADEMTRLQVSRKEEGLLVHDKDGSRSESGGLRRFSRNSVKHSSRMGSIAVFAEVVRLLDWMVILIIFTIASTLGSWLLPSTRPFPLPSYLFPSSSSSSSSRVNVTTSLVSGVPTMLSYPHGSSTVPYAVVMIVSLAVPFLLILFLMVFVVRLPLPNYGGANISKAPTYRPRLRLANTYILGLLLSLALTLFATNLLKNVIGKQRPDFWGRCGGVIQDMEIISKYTLPDYGLSGTSDESGTRMVTWEVCQNYYSDVIVKPTTGGSGLKQVSRGALQDGWRSFPSGHASISFAGLGYLSLFLAYVFGALGSRRKVRVGKERSILALVATVVPVLTAGYISATRYTDLMHGGADICAGVILGILGVAVGWGWYSVEVQAILDRGILDEEEDELREEKMKRKLPVEETCKSGAAVVPMMVRVEPADEIRAAR
ncbi:PAP2 superfamily-domain-containing protein [Tirmania nivea]|nr:PAP2 superfamily-domain-containing protein [Tirmania nivea]